MKHSVTLFVVFHQRCPVSCATTYHMVPNRSVTRASPMRQRSGQALEKLLERACGRNERHPLFEVTNTPGKTLFAKLCTIEQND